MRQSIIPTLWFDEQAGEASAFYTSLFDNSRIKAITRYGKSGALVSGKPEGSVMTVEFTLDGWRVIALNGGPVFKFTPSISLFVTCATAGEVEKLFAALADGGKVLMPLDRYPFSDRYAWFDDRYGLSWQLFVGQEPAVQPIRPCIMFSGSNYGKAVEAMTFYSSLFDRSGIDFVAPYKHGEGQKEGTVKHAAFHLGDDHFIAMDSGIDHAFDLTSAVSLMVECGNQAKIDRLWSMLSAVREAEQCGWLADRFGVSWQIVPNFFGTIDQSRDPARYERLMEVLLTMKKLDAQKLRDAYGQEGRQ